MRDKRAADDDEAARVLTYLAVIQIRAMARRREPFCDWMGDDYVACIAWLADLVHNLAGARPQAKRWQLHRKRHRSMDRTWAVADEAGRKWITDSLDKEGLTWRPPANSTFTSTRESPT